MRHVDLKLETELRRGIFQLAVLSLLVEPRYGYQIARLLADHGLAVEEGTLYPLLRRMEEQGLLESWWVTENVRPRKYYRTTEDGKKSLVLLLETWGRVDAALRGVLKASNAGAAGGSAPAPEEPPAGGGASADDPAGPGGEGASDG
jgi:DNA-binding PadR family transcriptional regulator